MSGDVEEFLRRLIEKQAAQQQPPRRAPAPVRSQQPARPMAPVRPMPQRPALRTLQPEVVDVVEIVDAEPATGADVARHVNQHLDTSEYQSRTGRLGAGVRAEEAAMQSHFKEMFGGGPKGQLAKSAAPEVTTMTGGAAPTTAAAAAQASAGPSVANQIISLINSPQDLRRAFLLGEILRRPNFDDV